MTTQSTPLASQPISILNSISEEKQITRNWIIYGSIAGILAIFFYVSAIAPIPIPDTLKLYLGMAFGPLISISFVGLYHFFKLHRKTVTLQAAVIFGIIAGTLVNLMIVVQSAIHLAIPAGARESLGLAMFNHPRFGKIWGVIMLLVGVGLITLNLATFPIPPADAGSFDLGPVSGLLYLLVSFRMLTSLKWVEAK